MADFYQDGLITTLHDLGTIGRDHLENLLVQATRKYKLGLVLPVTASDMRAAPFDLIVEQLKGVPYIDQIAVVLGIAPDPEDYHEAARKIAVLLGSAAVSIPNVEPVACSTVPSSPTTFGNQIINGGSDTRQDASVISSMATSINGPTPASVGSELSFCSTNPFGSTRTTL